MKLTLITQKLVVLFCSTGIHILLVIRKLTDDIASDLYTNFPHIFGHIPFKIYW
jgi:hypothetical protein